MIDGKKSFLDETVKSDIRTYDNIQKISTRQRDDYTTGCLPDYLYFKESYKLIAIDLSKPQALDVDPKVIEQINLTRNLHRAEGATIFSIIKKANETILDFSQGTVTVL